VKPARPVHKRLTVGNAALKTDEDDWQGF